MQKIVKTTGVIREQANSSNVHIEVVNLNTSFKKSAQVEVFTWVLDPVDRLFLIPQELTVTPTNKERIPPNHNAFFNADISNSSHYEVRITFYEDEENVIANIFEQDSHGDILKYILFKDLVAVYPIC